MRKITLIILSLPIIAAHAEDGVPIRREEVVVRAGLGGIDPFFSDRFAANGFYPGQDGIYIADGGRDEIKAFGYDGTFKRQLYLS